MPNKMPLTFAPFFACHMASSLAASAGVIWELGSWAVVTIVGLLSVIILTSKIIKIITSIGMAYSCCCWPWLWF